MNFSGFGLALLPPHRDVGFTVDYDHTRGLIVMVTTHN